MNPGVLLAFVAYGALACGDGLVKGLGTRLSVFEIAAFVVGFAALTTLFMRPTGERWRDVLRMRHPWLVLLRAASGLFAGLLGFFAFVTIPFAEAYALIFAAPFVVILLSILVLGERIGALTWGATLAGVAGVLLVVRPGLKAVEWGHAAALGAALFVATTVIILRRIGGTEKRTSLLLVPQLLAMTVCALAATPTFRPPTGRELAIMAAAGLIGALGQFALLAAARRAPASAIGQAQYSQLLWAVAIGALFYAEFPDPPALAGLALVAASGVANLAAARTRPAGGLP